MTRQTAISYEIPFGQLIHAFYLAWEKLPEDGPGQSGTNGSMRWCPGKKRTRQRHLRTFLIVSSEDWPSILRTTEVADHR